MHSHHIIFGVGNIKEHFYKFNLVFFWVNFIFRSMHSCNRIGSEFSEHNRFFKFFVQHVHLATQITPGVLQIANIGVPAPVTIDTNNIAKPCPFWRTAHDSYQYSKSSRVLFFHSLNKSTQKFYGNVTFPRFFFHSGKTSTSSKIFSEWFISDTPHDYRRMVLITCNQLVDILFTDSFSSWNICWFIIEK